MPADFQGLKIRISGSKIADRYFRDVGSIPQIMAFSEVYQALQTGVVDGCENTPSNYLTRAPKRFLMYGGAGLREFRPWLFFQPHSDRANRTLRPCAPEG